MKLLIVEDELIIRKGLITSFDWKAYGISEIVDAKNGKIALEKMETYTPDIVITDIRMPVMDGLTLAAEIKKQNDLIHIIILSGYQDFEYAQQAIKLGVSEYLTKPVGIEELGEVMTRVKQEIREEEKQRSEFTRIQTIYEDNWEVICDGWLNSLLYLKDDVTSEAVEYGKKLGLEMPGPHYQLLLIKTNDLLATTDQRHGNADVLYREIEKSIREVLADGFEYTTWYRRLSGVCLILNIQEKDDLELTKLAQAMIERVKEKQMKTLIIGVSTMIDSIYEMHHAYHQAKQALEQNEHQGVGGVYFTHIETSHMNKTIRTAINYLENNYQRQITLEMMAKYSFVSPSYFSKLFKKETGESFIKWLNLYRIKQAKKLLEENTAIPIYVVAEMVGIPNYKHFVNVFKEEVSQTPSEYRAALNI